MRHGCWAIPLAFLSCLAAAEARAQSYPRTVHQAAYYNTYRNYYGQPETPASPSDAPPMPPGLTAPGPMDVAPVAPPGGAAYYHASCDPVCAPCNTGCGCDTGCASCDSCSSCCEEEEDECGCDGEEDEVWRLFGDMELIPGTCCCDPPTVFVGGWVQGGITGNGDGNDSATGNFPVPYNFVSDGFIFNQAPWVYAEKVADTGGEGFAWGARIDYLFGTDSRFTNAFGDRGWDFDWTSGRDYGSAIPQLYGDVAYNNWLLRLGHFYTIIGYEVVPAIGNFFYSHALTQNFGEPFTHTGGLVKFTPDDAWTFYGGYTMGWDSGWENLNDAHTFLGGLAYAWEDIGTLTWGVNAGDWGDGSAFPGASTGDIYMSSLVGVVNLTDDIQYVIEHDHGVNNNVPGGPGAEWYGIVNYLFINLTETIRFGGRFEWFDDQDGARIGALVPTPPAAAGPGPAGDYYCFTMGLNWTPHPNFRVRPEIRKDFFDGAAVPGRLPFDGGTDDDLTTFGVDGIFQF
jgi:hypothetical protein